MMEEETAESIEKVLDSRMGKKGGSFSFVSYKEKKNYHSKF